MAVRHDRNSSTNTSIVGRVRGSIGPAGPPGMPTAAAPPGGARRHNYDLHKWEWHRNGEKLMHWWQSRHHTCTSRVGVVDRVVSPRSDKRSSRHLPRWDPG